MGANIRKPESTQLKLLVLLVACGAIAVVVCGLNPDGKRPNPSHAGTDVVSHPVSQDDLHHGDLQVRRMIEDRPAMRRYVKRGDEIWQWATRQFAGEGLGMRVYWDSAPPTPGVLGMNKYTGDRHTIRISSEDNGTPLTGEQLWGVVVFELYNTYVRRRWARMDADAKLGKISKQEWINTAQNLEFQSAKATKTFFLSVWIPHLNRLGISGGSSMWHVNLPNSFEEFLSQPYTRYSDYRNQLEATFDTQIAPKINHP